MEASFPHAFESWRGELDAASTTLLLFNRLHTCFYSRSDLLPLLSNIRAGCIAHALLHNCAKMFSNVRSGCTAHAAPGGQEYFLLRLSFIALCADADNVKASFHL
eukprot:243573-Pelagomonas_calceolata.AAC.3